MKLLCLRLRWAFDTEKHNIKNLILKFVPYRTYSFWEMDVYKFFVFNCFCQYIVEVNEETPWYQFFAKILPMFCE